MREDDDLYTFPNPHLTFTARWWHKSGFWTTGTFNAPDIPTVERSIASNGGTNITVTWIGL